MGLPFGIQLRRLLDPPSAARVWRDPNTRSNVAAERM
jgi:hypothetical protein